MRQKTVLSGKGKLACQALEYLYERQDEYGKIIVLPVIPEPTWTDSLVKKAESYNLEIVYSGHYRDVDWEGVDLLISIFYDKIYKKEQLEKVKKSINLHCAPLPKYRGMKPINHALKNEEKEHGVTIHEILPGIDNGGIISQVKFTINPEIDEVVDVYGRCLEHGWLLFQHTMPQLDKINPRPQNDEEAIYYSSKDDHLLGDRADFRRKDSND